MSAVCCAGGKPELDVVANLSVAIFPMACWWILDVVALGFRPRAKRRCEAGIGRGKLELGVES